MKLKRDVCLGLQHAPRTVLKHEPPFLLGRLRAMQKRRNFQEERATVHKNIKPCRPTYCTLDQFILKQPIDAPTSPILVR